MIYFSKVTQTTTILEFWGPFVLWSLFCSQAYSAHKPLEVVINNFCDVLWGVSSISCVSQLTDVKPIALKQYSWKVILGFWSGFSGFGSGLCILSEKSSQMLRKRECHWLSREHRLWSYMHEDYFYGCSEFWFLWLFSNCLFPGDAYKSLESTV